MSLNNFSKDMVSKKALQIKSKSALAPLIGLSVFTAFSFLIFGCAAAPKLHIEAVPVDRFEPYAGPEGRFIFPQSVDTDIPNVDILALSDDIKSLLDESVIPIRNQKSRLNELEKILNDRVKYDVKNDRYGTRTAQETYEAGTANCLSFSNLFVAMARYIGLSAQFQEVPTPPNWIRTGEMIFNTRHIGALVDVNDSSDHIIHLDFRQGNTIVIWNSGSNQYFFSPSYFDAIGNEINPHFGRSIPDHSAFAQYYNNIASLNLSEGNLSDAFRYFIKAIKIDPKLSYAWSNLGVVYRRNNQYEAAEAAFLQGLNVVPRQDDITVLNIMNNMVKLYEQIGDKEKTAFYLKKVASFRERNPYYLYSIARKSYDDAFYERAVKYYKAAIHRKDDDHLFYYGLAMAYFKLGDLEKAEKNINKAKYYAWDEDKKAYYDQVRNTLVNSTAKK